MKKIEQRRGSPVKKIVLIAVLVLGYLGLAGAGGYFYWRYRQVMENPAKYIDIKKYAPTPEQENQQLLEQIGSLITLPKDETPVITTIKDVEKLKNDQFFADAMNGDRLVIFQAAKQAILYRESERKIIKAGPVLLPESEKKKVSLVASAEQGAALQKQLTDTYKDDAQVLATVAPAMMHESLVVVDVSGKNAQLAQKIATTLGGTVATAMPEGEPVPTGAELVVIAATP
jgi:hypothetical protein